MKRTIFTTMLLLIVSQDVWADSFSWKMTKFLHKTVAGGHRSLTPFLEHPGDTLSAFRAGADCTEEGAAFVDQIISWRAPIHDRAVADAQSGIRIWTPENMGKEFQELHYEYDEKWLAALNSDEMQAYIVGCANKRGYGFDVMSTQGAINWTNDRINEYREYLPRLWCNEEVYSWMSANDSEAKSVLPKLEAAISAGVRKHYEWSPVHRPLYLEYKNLEAMHQDVYDDEGHVFRTAANACDRMPKPTTTDDPMTPDEALETCDVLGFQRGTDSHSNCALKLLTEN